MTKVILLVLQDLLQLLLHLLVLIPCPFCKLKLLLRPHLPVPPLEQLLFRQLGLFADPSECHLVMERPFHQSLSHEHGLKKKGS